MFRTQYDRIRVNTESGKGDAVTYSIAYDPDTGERFLKETGKVNLYEQIQSYKESVDIHNILERFARGDVDVVNQRQGVFMDVTEMPKTFAEMYQRVADAEALFMQLPVEERAKFNHNPVEYLSALSVLMSGKLDIQDIADGTDKPGSDVLDAQKDEHSIQEGEK